MERPALPGLGAGADQGSSVVELRSASAQVASILRREIQGGHHPPSSRLRQREVAARPGVSTTPVREAFQVLQAEGFLVVENHRGAVVVQPSAEDIREGYAIRTALEALAVHEATAHFDQDAAGPLSDLLARMRGTTDRDQWVALDLEFHRRLHEMAAMPRLAGLIEQLRGGITFYIESAFDVPDQRRAADDDHVALLDACRHGDPERAEAVLREHLGRFASDRLDHASVSGPRSSASR